MHKLRLALIPALLLALSTLLAPSAAAVNANATVCPETATGTIFPLPTTWTITATPSSGSNVTGTLDSTGCVQLGLNSTGSPWALTAANGTDTITLPNIAVSSGGIVTAGFATTPSGAAGGCLSGNYPNPTIGTCTSAVTLNNAAGLTISQGGIIDTGNITVAGTVAVTSTSSSALSAGANGATTPALNVDASTASSVTGLDVKSAAAGGGLALSTISSAGQTNENLTLDAKGAGTITIGGTSTGAVAVSSGAGSGNVTLANSAVTATRGGGLQVGSPTGGDEGAGTLNATNVYVNGTAVLTTSNPTFLTYRAAGIGAGATDYLPLGGGNLATTESIEQAPIPAAITFTKMYAYVDVAPGVGKNIVITLRKAGSNQTITCTISGTNTQANDTAHSATFAAGDLISVQAVSDAGIASNSVIQVNLSA